MKNSCHKLLRSDLTGLCWQGGKRANVIHVEGKRQFLFKRDTVRIKRGIGRSMVVNNGKEQRLYKE